MAAEIFSCPAKLRFKYGNDKCVVGSAQLEDLKKTDCSLIIDCAIKGKRVETRVDALLRSDPRRKGKQSLYVHVRFTPMEKITRTKKLLLAFDAVAMSESLCQTLQIQSKRHKNTGFTPLSNVNNQGMFPQSEIIALN